MEMLTGDIDDSEIQTSQRMIGIDFKLFFEEWAGRGILGLAKVEVADGEVQAGFIGLEQGGLLICLNSLVKESAVGGKPSLDLVGSGRVGRDSKDPSIGRLCFLEMRAGSSL